MHVNYFLQEIKWGCSCCMENSSCSHASCMQAGVSTWVDTPVKLVDSQCKCMRQWKERCENWRGIVKIDCMVKAAPC